MNKEVQGILMLTVNGYVCKCPICGKDHLSQISMRKAEQQFGRHYLKKHPPVEASEEASGAS